MEEEEAGDEEEIPEERVRMRLPPPPLLDSLPSRACREMLKRIRSGGTARDILIREIRALAGRGGLAKGEARCLRSEIDSLFGERHMLRKEPEAGEALFVEGAAGTAHKGFKPRVFRPRAARPPREPERTAVQGANDSFARLQGHRGLAISQVPAVGNAGAIFGTRIGMRGRG